MGLRESVFLELVVASGDGVVGGGEVFVRERPRSQGLALRFPRDAVVLLPPAEHGQRGQRLRSTVVERNMKQLQSLKGLT